MKPVDLVELKKSVQEANRKIAKIEKRYGNNYGYGSWAVRGLYDALDNTKVNGINIFGKVNIDKNMTASQLRAVANATEKFLKAKTSTLKGINEVKKNVKKGLQKTLADPDPKNPKLHRDVSDRDVELLYSFVEDKTLRSTVEKIGASTTWNFLVDNKEKMAGWTDEQKDAFGFQEFYEDVKNHSEVIPDQQMREDLETIYNKYFS